MGGGLMQLVAYGAQDVYLTGNPQITFFKVVYRRHTNFAVEAIEQTFNGNPALGSKATVQITRNGDLVTKMYLKCTLTGDAGTASCVNPGNGVIKTVELQIGGTKIDKHYGEWLTIWSELSRPAGKDRAYWLMQGLSSTGATQDMSGGVQCFVPLQFFCCRNDGLALPLIALQYHDVRLEFEFQAAGTVLGATDDIQTMTNVSLLVDYVYLDSEERKRFAQASHEYLIEQVQTQQGETGSTNLKVRLNFNHPVKELVWAGHANADASANEHGKLSGVTTDAILKLNGHDRFSVQNGDYFANVQPFQHHTRTPGNSGVTANKNVYVYSFALNPEEHQPSGSCNFSRIDNAELQLTVPNAGDVFNVYAVNYNVLRIMSGMGGLAYSN